jgi:prepilin-type N-terminal cleavage/methylation domain-containing protein
MAPHSDRSGRQVERGFTLIEIMVVLAIIAAVGAIAYSVFAPIYARVRIAWERDDIERQLFEMPQRARQNGRGGILTGQSGDALADDTLLVVEGSPLAGKGMERWQVMRLRIPPGWRLEIDRPIFYHFSGACEGGEVLFHAPDGVPLYYRLAAPLCRPIRTDPQG